MAPWLAGEGLLSTTNQTVTDRAAGRAVGQPWVCVCACVCVPQSAMMLTVVGPLARWRDLAAFFSPRCRSALSAILPSHLSLPCTLAVSLAQSVETDLVFYLSFSFFDSLSAFVFPSHCHLLSYCLTLCCIVFSLVFNCEFICVNLVDVTVIKTECVVLSSWVLINEDGN